jgi:hypothetical protein
MDFERIVQQTSQIAQDGLMSHRRSLQPDGNAIMQLPALFIGPAFEKAPECCDRWIELAGVRQVGHVVVL